MLLGLERRARTARGLFGRRLFPERVGLPEELRGLYEGRVRARPGEKGYPWLVCVFRSHAT